MDKHYEPIAIIGTSCRLPGNANELDELWSNLSADYDAVVDIPNTRCFQEDIYNPIPEVGKSYAKKAGLLEHIEHFDGRFFGITEDEAIAMDPQQRLLLEASWHALEDSLQLNNKVLLKETGLIVGMVMDDYSQLGMHSHDLNEVNTYRTLGSFRSISAGRVAYHLGLNGPVSQIDTACSSSLMAIHQACQSLRLHESDCMLAGGINLILSPQSMVALSQIKALSLSSCCRVFDNRADGYVRGEGYGLVVLKRLCDAQANNDNILAVIKGSLANHDGASNGLTAPNGLAQESLLQKTLQLSHLKASDINYVETHGTGTLFGDPIEVNSIINVYGKERKKNNPLFLGSIKSSIGHLEAAAGVAGVLKVCASLKNKQLAANLHFFEPNLYIKWNKAPIKVIDKLQPWKASSLKTAAVSSFGFSGTNVHLILQEYEKDESSASKEEDDCYLIPICAKSEMALKQLVQKWTKASYLKEESLKSIAYSAFKTRQQFDSKIILAVKNYEELIEALNAWLNEQNSPYIYTNTSERTQSSLAKKYLDAIEQCFNTRDFDWEDLYGKETVKPCKLPLYAFEQISYWWDNPYSFNLTKPSKVSYENAYSLQWESYDIKEAETSKHIHLISDSKNDNITQLLSHLSLSAKNNMISTSQFIQEAILEDTNYLYVLDMNDDINVLHQHIHKAWQVVQYFVQHNQRSKLWIVTEQSQWINPKESFNVTASSIWGFFRSLRLELEHSWGGMIDIPFELTSTVIEQLQQCLSQRSSEDQYVLRNEKVYVPKLQNYGAVTKQSFTFDTSASYLITGGLGALGMALVEHLVSVGIKHILIASRKAQETLKCNSEVASKIQQWQKVGVNIELHSLDLTQKNQVQAYFNLLKQERVNLKGIVHLSGVISKQDLSNHPNENDMQQFMYAKAKGAWHLHQYSHEFHLDFFVLFSSVTALFGMKSLGFYSASNAYLDALSAFRNQQGLKSLSINWGRFDIDGMVDDVDSLVLDTLGIEKLNTKKSV
jgi:acyl transferase domain-containing protein